MNDIQKIKEFFSKPLEEATFKVGDKVTYLGHPGVITAVNKEMTGSITYSVSYDKGQGKTKASNISNKGGEIKPLKEAKKETAIDMVKKKLDALGVKYEMSDNKFRPFKAIYKPINKSDEFYDKFNDIVDLANLKGVVKSSMSEASSTEKFLRKLGWAGEDWTPQEFASQIKKLSDSTLISWAKSNKGIGKGIPNTPLAFQQKLVKIEMDKRGLSLDEAKEKYYVESSKKGFSVLRNGNEITSFDTEEEAKQHANKLNKFKFLSKEKTNEANGFTSGKQFINIKLQRYPKAVAKINQLINMIGESNFTMEMAEWIWDFFNNASFESPVNEATKEEETTFHKKLDKLVHDTFGKRKGEMEEAELSEAYVPSNIKEFAKRKGVSSLVNKVAGWAEKVGKGIRGGTAIGYNYSTLILDMTYQGSEIRINTDNDTVTLYDEPVNSFPEFKQVYLDNQEESGNDLEERISEALNKINEELCPAGKAYIKRRKAAGEKSSAYLSGRAVKVCKGQMSGKSKKKK